MARTDPKAALYAVKRFTPSHLREIARDAAYQDVIGGGFVSHGAAPGVVRTILSVTVLGEKDSTTGKRTTVKAYIVSRETDDRCQIRFERTIEEPGKKPEVDESFDNFLYNEPTRGDCDFIFDCFLGYLMGIIQVVQGDEALARFIKAGWHPKD